MWSRLVVEVGGAGDLVAELVGHGGEGAGDGLPARGPGRGEVGVGVDDPAQARVPGVEHDVVDRVDAGTQPALDAVGHPLRGHRAAFEVDHHQSSGRSVS